MDKNVCPLCGGDKAAAHILCIDCFNILGKDRAWKFDDLIIFLSKETARADAAEKELENTLSAVMDAVSRARGGAKSTRSLQEENEKLTRLLAEKEAELARFRLAGRFSNDGINLAGDYEVFYRETKR